MPLPLGEVSPQVTERAHAANPVAKVSEAIRNFPTMPRAPSLREFVLTPPVKRQFWKIRRFSRIAKL